VQIQQDFQYPQIEEETALVILPQLLEVLVVAVLGYLQLPIETVQPVQLARVMRAVMAPLANFHLVLVLVVAVAVLAEWVVMPVVVLRVLVVAVLLG
jgi:hypothetical protein